MYFECRLKFGTVPNTGTNATNTSFFIGLGSAGGLTSDPVGTTTYSTTPGLLGFGCLSGDTAGQIGWVYNKATGGTVSQQSASGMTGLNLLTMVTTAVTNPNLTNNIGPGVYFKLGFKYDSRLNTVTPYINGLAQDGISGPNKIIGAGTTSTNLGASAPGTASTTAWPAAPLTLVAGLFQTSTTPYQIMTLDWWAAAQAFG